MRVLDSAGSPRTKGGSRKDLCSGNTSPACRAHKLLSVALLGQGPAGFSVASQQQRVLVAVGAECGDRMGSDCLSHSAGLPERRVKLLLILL